MPSCFCLPGLAGLYRGSIEYMLTDSLVGILPPACVLRLPVLGFCSLKDICLCPILKVI